MAILAFVKSGYECDCFHGKFDLFHLAYKFTIEKEQMNTLNFLVVIVHKEETGFLTRVNRMLPVGILLVQKKGTLV